MATRSRNTNRRTRNNLKNINNNKSLSETDKFIQVLLKVSKPGVMG